MKPGRVSGTMGEMQAAAPARQIIGQMEAARRARRRRIPLYDLDGKTRRAVAMEVVMAAQVETIEKGCGSGLCKALEAGGFSIEA